MNRVLTTYENVKDSLTALEKEEKESIITKLKPAAVEIMESITSSVQRYRKGLIKVSEFKENNSSVEKSLQNLHESVAEDDHVSLFLTVTGIQGKTCVVDLKPCQNVILLDLLFYSI